MAEKKRSTAETVWNAAKGTMYQTAYDVLKNRADAEDAVMDAMERIVKNERKFSGLGEADMRALSSIYVRYTAINRYNRNAKEPYPMEELPEDAGIPDVSPEDTFLSEESCTRIVSAIRALPPSCRDVLLLCARYGMRPREAAAVLHIPAGAVRTRLSRARALLREILENENGGDSG